MRFCKYSSKCFRRGLVFKCAHHATDYQQLMSLNSAFSILSDSNNFKKTFGILSLGPRRRDARGPRMRQVRQGRGRALKIVLQFNHLLIT